MRKIYLALSILLLASCASVISGQLRFQDRELLPHPDKPGLGYPHKVTVCAPRFILGVRAGSKCHQEARDDFYDMNDPATRKSLIDAGFTCTSKMRFKY